MLLDAGAILLILLGHLSWANAPILASSRAGAAGRNKVGLIRSNAILKWNYEKFEQYLARLATRLMVIGYGFADDHVNASIVEAHQCGSLQLIYLVHPFGKAILDRYPTAAIRVPQPIMDIPCIECTVPLKDAFSTDHMAQSLLEGIFT